MSTYVSLCLCHRFNRQRSYSIDLRIVVLYPFCCGLILNPQVPCVKLLITPFINLQHVIHHFNHNVCLHILPSPLSLLIPDLFTPSQNTLSTPNSIRTFLPIVNLSSLPSYTKTVSLPCYRIRSFFILILGLYVSSRHSHLQTPLLGDSVPYSHVASYLSDISFSHTYGPSS